MSEILCLVARCRACGKIGAGAFIGPEKSESKCLAKIVQKALRGYAVTVENGPVFVSGCGCTDEQRREAM